MPPTDPDLDTVDEPLDDEAADGDRHDPAGPTGGGLPARRGSGTAVSREELERVIRRASELQFRSSTSVGTALQPADVVQIGAEVGLDERHVRQALAEVQAAALVPALPEDSGFARKLIGPAAVTASRVVPGDRGHVEHNLEGYLREKELLKQVRSRPGRSLWEPAGGVVSSMRRAMDVGGHGYWFAKAHNVSISIEPLEDGWSLVTITIDMSNLRRERSGGWFFGFGLGGAGMSAALIVATGGGILPVLGGIALFSGVIGGATALARNDMAKQRQRMQLALEGLLDRLERGENLHDEAEPWHRRLLG